MKILVHVPVGEDGVRRILEVVPDAEVICEEGEEEAARLMGGVEILFGFFTREMIQASDSLKWIQTASAGMDKHLPPEVLERDILLTNASGVHAVQVAEHAWALTMCLIRGFPEAFRNQQARQWKRSPVQEVYGSTVGIVGLGGIGRRYAHLAKAFGARAIGLDIQAVDRPEAVDEVWEIGRLDDLMRVSDIVFISCPHTSETENLIDAEKLAQMKPTALLVNTARGQIVDEEALIQVLQDGLIAGAGLDVTRVEPLPDDSPLWSMANVVLTHHNAGGSPARAGRLVALFCENLKRFVAGETLTNIVDKELGYPAIEDRKQWDL